MKDEVILRPTYWVGHHKEELGVIFETMSCLLCETCAKMDRLLGLEWRDDPDIEVILVQLHQAPF